MTTTPEPKESRMLQLVRRWRREAYEARPQTEEERRKQEAELLGRFGLKPRTERPEDQ
jgi:hypothetical protein